MPERISVPGIKPNGTSIEYDVNPNGQSFLIKNGSWVLVTRELGQSHTEVTGTEEVLLRRTSTELYRQFAPDYVLPTSHVLLQGQREDGSDAVLLGRFSPKVEGARSLTDIKTREILSNPKLCRDIARISFGQFKMVLKTGKLPDSGGRGGFGSSLPRPISAITTRLTSNNILVGHDDEGNTITFCDPDWCIEPQGSPRTKAVARAKYACLYAARSAFFYTASVMPDFVRRN